MSYCKLSKKWTQNQWERSYWVIYLKFLVQISVNMHLKRRSRVKYNSDLVKTDGEHLIGSGFIFHPKHRGKSSSMFTNQSLTMCGESGPCPVGFRAFKLKKHLPDAVENDSRTVMTVNKKCKKKNLSLRCRKPPTCFRSCVFVCCMSVSDVTQQCFGSFKA